MLIGAEIYLKRLERGMTQAELAKKAQIPQPNLSNIEKNKQDLTVSTLRRIAYALDVEPGNFFMKENLAKSRLMLTRGSVEKIALAVVRGGVILSGEEKRIARLLKSIVLIPSKDEPSKRKMRRAWIILRRDLSREEIEGLHVRIQDALLRAR
jgi:transcriptional regulator with XRE-family HTH domain